MADCKYTRVAVRMPLTVFAGTRHEAAGRHWHSLASLPRCALGSVAATAMKAAGGDGSLQPLSVYLPVLARGDTGSKRKAPPLRVFSCAALVGAYWR